MLGTGSPVRAQLAAARTNVKVLTGLTIGVQCCCGLLFLLPLGIFVVALPDGANFSAELRRDCAEGKIEPAVCQQLQHALHKACSDAGSGHGDCKDLPEDQVKIILVLVLAVCVVCLALCTAVPLCGYCGARNNNRCCVTVYMGFSLLVVLSFIVNLVQHGARGISLWSLVSGCVVPGLGFYYSYKLLELQAAPPEIGAPLLRAPAPMYPQLAAGLAPTVGQEPYVPIVGQALYAPSAPPPGAA